MLNQTQSGPIELRCPDCGRYLGTLEGTYFRSPPCVCGLQMTIQMVGKRARRTVACGPREIEVK